MRRIELIVAYDGTKYCGWQVQNNGITIEEVLNRELSIIHMEYHRIPCPGKQSNELKTD